MTVIAFRDGVLAADSLITGGGTRIGYGTKIRKIGPVLAGASGTWAKAQAFLDWFSGGMDGDPPEMGEKAEGLLIYDGRIATWQDDGWDHFVAPYYAIGCGANEARGALAAGMSAYGAVEAACLVDVHCGGPIEELTVR